jgi:hypothetical protein
VQVARPRQIGRDGTPLELNAEGQAAAEQRETERNDGAHARILRERAGPHMRFWAAARPVLALTFLGSSFSAAP